MLGKIYIDESGFTGADYCNEDQPLYVLACTWFEPDFARRIEDKLLSLYGHKELKFSRLICKEAGRQALIEAIHLIGKNQSKARFAVYVVHKSTALVRKFVLDCIEPFYHQAGIEMLKEGRSITYANLIALITPSAMGQEWFAEFLKLYNLLIRTKSVRDNKRLYEHCLICESNDLAKDIFKPYLLMPDAALAQINEPNYTPDIYLMIVFGLVTHIRNQFAINEFDLLLDQTKATTATTLIKNLKALESLEKRYKISDICTLYDDIKIKGVTMADSQDEIGIRMSDLIAGLYSWCFKSTENMASPVTQAIKDNLPEESLIHMLTSKAITAEELGMENTINPWSNSDLR